ncbi:MAG: phosphoribosyltransferase family protein [Eubacterium sp.]|jgi:adenine phosphoribosyltransferase|nr:phosphoribosyltransferase family protein [Eubacterium sp.]
MFYEIEIAGVKRELKLFKLNDQLAIAGFVMFGDIEITEASAKALLEKAPEFDYIVTAESKGIPLAYEMSRQSGKEYVVARKGAKVYMENIVETDVDSITTRHRQKLCFGQAEADKLRGKKVLVVDDVISTGASLESLEELIKKVDGNIVGKMAVLAEGDAQSREDIITLANLPLFTTDGKPL